jgi:sec-independent protein translocase protein TatB
MFDIGWSELLVVAIVAIIVVGPKDLPGMLRVFGKTMNQVRRTANDFKRQFNDALREAETESGLKDTTDQLKSIGSINPVADVKESLNELKKDVSAAGDDPGAVDTIDGGRVDTDSGADEPATENDTASAEKQVKSGSDAA